MKKEPIVIVSCSMPQSLADALSQRCAKDDIKRSAAIRRLVRRWLRTKEGSVK